jgi:hypothetical protein
VTLGLRLVPLPDLSLSFLSAFVAGTVALVAAAVIVDAAALLLQEEEDAGFDGDV